MTTASRLSRGAPLGDVASGRSDVLRTIDASMCIQAYLRLLRILLACAVGMLMSGHHLKSPLVSVAQRPISETDRSGGVSGSLGTPILGVIECRLYGYIGCKVVSRESCERNDVGRFVTVQKQGERLDEHVGWVEQSEPILQTAALPGVGLMRLAWAGWVSLCSTHPTYLGCF